MSCYHLKLWVRDVQHLKMYEIDDDTIEKFKNKYHTDEDGYETVDLDEAWDDYDDEYDYNYDYEFDFICNGDQYTLTVIDENGKEIACLEEGIPFKDDDKHRDDSKLNKGKYFVNWYHNECAVLEADIELHEPFNPEKLYFSVDSLLGRDCADPRNLMYEDKKGHHVPARGLDHQDDDGGYCVTKEIIDYNGDGNLQTCPRIKFNDLDDDECDD